MCLVERKEINIIKSEDNRCADVVMWDSPWQQPLSRPICLRKKTINRALQGKGSRKLRVPHLGKDFCTGPVDLGGSILHCIVWSRDMKRTHRLHKIPIKVATWAPT